MLTLKAQAVVLLETKKSRFLATAHPADTEEAAREFIARIRLPEATHNAWAYRMETDQYRFCDDGEVAGTAGRPIFQAMEGRGLTRVVVMVSRHYGGIKLGTGGLVRAYGGAAAKALEAAGTEEIRPTMILHVEVPFEDLGSALGVLHGPEILDLQEQYHATGVRFRIRIDPAHLPSLEDALLTITKGKATLIRPKETSNTP